ncbi:restriction endonuclease subunit S [Methanoplanus endosymbiosus]|uniref:Restriction endonuclease subunit S n=1 Tax=Methanoplanus endosymbiosus TaxID=33865 RepID=A0A9E7PN87_9EURY|nr:restriction endonuclease subunit S [Methanoplanus endosymbiosus]UUX93379.1 restriction endonuclease subunit S [Methanoplanus endosymbiosus]
MKSKTDQMDKTDNGDSEDSKTMSSDILTENFDTITKANGGIKKLRELILQLAVQGKLVPQNPGDEPASILLEKIKEEKQNLIKTGQIKKQKPLPPIEENEVPYELPEGWIWTRLETILSEAQTGFACGKRDPEGIIQLRMNNVNTKGSFNWNKIIRVPKDYNNKIGFYLLREGDILFNNTNSIDLVGKSARFDYFEQPIVFSNHFTRLRVIEDTPNSSFITIWLNNLWSANVFKNLCNKWVNQSAINRDKLKNLTFPLPPLAEQHRIVERVDALMKLCDDLESRQESESENRRLLLLSVLKNLEDAGSEEEKQEAWEILSGRFDDLINSAEDVKELRKTVLQLAVQGRLVPQNPEDEPASVLLEKIKEEKQNLIRTGKIKKQKPLPPIDEEEVPYELPEGWTWTRLNEIVSKIGSGNTPRGGKSVYQNSGIPFIRSQNIWNEGLKLDNVAYIPEEIHSNMAGTFIKPRDILLNITGASIGRSCLIRDTFKEGNVSQHVSIIRSLNENTREYLHLTIISPYFQNEIMTKQVGISREGLSKRILESFAIPLPPLAEQHRIVERVDALMKLCDELEKRVVAREEAAERLLSSVCAGICG